MQMSRRLVMAAVLTGFSLMVSTAQAVNVKVTIENLTPTGGVFNTPVWVGFHDGNFDLYDMDAPVSMSLERLAEDGSIGDLSAEFLSMQADAVDGVVLDPAGFEGAPVFEPGSKSSLMVDIDPMANQYFSYASMVIPSNDAFVANGDPMAHRLFDDNGGFIGPISITVFGSQVLDAGSEDNTEEDAAFLNQMAPDTGVSSNGVVMAHPGFNGSVGNADGMPQNILGGTAASGDVIDATQGDFSRPNYQVLRITISNAMTPVRLTVKNKAPADGVYLTPVWAGFHDGSFNVFDTGSAASMELERLAEDGSIGGLSDLFLASQANGVDGIVMDPEGFPGAPLFDPGSASSLTLDLDPMANPYFSYASMVIPSNDAFIGNDNPMAYRLFNEEGDFTGPVSFRVMGSHVLDAGTEDNTETDAAFFDQMGPDTGVTSNGMVSMHPGYNGSVGNPAAMPKNILGGTNGAGIFFDETAADFSAAGYEVAEITISRAVDGSFSGTWYDPMRDGEGILLEVTSDHRGEPKVVISMYSYAADSSGSQMWLMGDGPVVGDTAFVEMFVTSGAQFGAAFVAEDVVREHWGQLQLRFTDCGTAILTFVANDPAFGMGQMDLMRLTSGPIDFAGACN